MTLLGFFSLAKCVLPASESFQKLSSALQKAPQLMAQPEGWPKSLANLPNSRLCRIDENRLA